jgi:hypothetical protein
MSVILTIFPNNSGGPLGPSISDLISLPACGPLQTLTVSPNFGCRDWWQIEVPPQVPEIPYVPEIPEIPEFPEEPPHVCYDCGPPTIPPVTSVPTPSSIALIAPVIFAMAVCGVLTRRRRSV